VSAFPASRLVETNGVRLAVHEAGPRGGIPLVLLHGFPELAYSWRRQLTALAEAGRWVIAPDQRGYGGSDKPRPVQAYDIEQLTGDLIGLLDALGAEKAIWVGHDWGGLVAWDLPRRHPERTAGVVGLNTPFLPRGEVEPITAIRTRFGPHHYIVWFQHRRLPELLFEADVRRSFRFFMRRAEASPRPSPEGRAHLFAFKQAFDFFRASDDAHQLLSPEDLEVYVRAFGAGGFRGPINWYRNMTRDWELQAGLPERVDQPALMITAENDPFLPPHLADGMERFVPDLETRMILDCGHWTQQERPEEVNRLLLDWLDRRFPLGPGAGTA
jgi:pimeloyl-ACP methyl ester carboxylesterase